MRIPGPKPKLWRGRRNCDKCTRWRPVSDFTVYKTRTGYEQITGTCEVCKREAERERYDRLTAEQKHAKGKQANVQARKRRDKALHMIERQRKVLDHQNVEIARQYRRLEKVKNKYRVPYGSNTGNGVDITPFRMWLLRKNRERGYNTAQLALQIGQDRERVQRWLQGFYWNGTGEDPIAVRAIEVSTIDSIGVALEDPELLERLYPLEVDE